jgi:hypothetical protein
MVTKKQLDELSVGGGTTGVSMVPDAGTKKTTLPNSKSQGDMNPQSVAGDQEETDPQNNSAPTGDMSAQNKASVAMKGAAMKEHIDAMFNGEDLSEDFKEKASTIFEAAVQSRISEEIAELEQQYSTKLEEALEEVLLGLLCRAVDEGKRSCYRAFFENRDYRRVHGRYEEAIC